MLRACASTTRATSIAAHRKAARGTRKKPRIYAGLRDASHREHDASRDTGTRANERADDARKFSSRDVRMIVAMHRAR